MNEIRYANLLSPIKVNGTVLKNRMIASNALPHFTQGPEKYPNDAIIDYLAGLARNGAAIVTFADWSMDLRGFGHGDICHFPVYDITDPATENSMNQLADAIHFYGSKVSLALSVHAPQGYGVNTTSHFELPVGMGEMFDGEEMPKMSPMMEKMMKSGTGSKMMSLMMRHSPKSKKGDKKGGGMLPLPPGMSFGPEKAVTPEIMQNIIQDTINCIRYYKNCGFDMVTLHMAYRSSLAAQFLSPLTNHRTDEFGGSLENRARFPLMLCDAIKKEFGSDFLIEVQISGEDGMDGGFTIDDLTEFAKLAEGKIDILQLRAGNGDDAHPTGFNSIPHEPLTLRYAEAVRKSGAKILAEPIGGFQNPDDMERFLKEGKADLFGMARAFICDFDFGKKLASGQGEDITPCIRCNRCHGLHMDGPWLTVCSVNPKMGIEHRLDKLVSMPDKKRKVAVIGGGLSGMEAAVTASDRGHKVVLYEASNRLGGQLNEAGYPDFKWPIKDFMQHMIYEVNKREIEVRLSNAPSPEEIREEAYDAVLACVGAAPAVPPIEGVLDQSGNPASGIWNPLAVYGHEAELGKKVIVVGGSDNGVECAMYLADTGHQVLVLTRSKRLASGSNRVHYYSTMRKYWRSLENFQYKTLVSTKHISKNKVTYMDKDGHTVSGYCDSVVVCGGMRPLTEHALQYAGCAPVFRLVGDCEKIGNIQSAMRNGFAAGSSI